MGYGEDALVRKLNNHFLKEKVKAFAYRHPQIRGRKQFCDVNVDSRRKAWYLAVEVKMISTMRPLNFRSDFKVAQWKNGKMRYDHQLVRMVEYAKQTDREAIVYLIVKMNGKNNKRYSFSAKKLLQWMKKGNASLSWKLYDEWNIGWFDTK